MQAEGRSYLENEHPCYLEMCFMSVSFLDMFRYHGLGRKSLAGSQCIGLLLPGSVPLSFSLDLTLRTL